MRCGARPPSAAYFIATIPDPYAIASISRYDEWYSTRFETSRGDSRSAIAASGATTRTASSPISRNCGSANAKSPGDSLRVRISRSAVEASQKDWVGGAGMWGDIGGGNYTAA